MRIKEVVDNLRFMISDDCTHTQFEYTEEIEMAISELEKRVPKIHNIKLNIEFCDAVLNGEKTFEIRENDRGYQKGDHIRFKPVDCSPFQCFPYHAIQEREYEITYVLNGWGLKDGFVALSIKETERSDR